MADLGTEIRTYLIADSAIAALVGDAIEPDVLPQGYSVRSGPAIVYTIINTISDHLINGLAGIARSRVEFTVYAKHRVIANQVAEAVRACGLIGYVGQLGDITIESVMLETGAQYFSESPTDGTQEHRYLTVFDFLVAYQETT